MREEEVELRGLKEGVAHWMVVLNVNRGNQ
jgi:hypothetical protein